MSGAFGDRMRLLLDKLKALRPWDRFHPHQLGAAYARGEAVPTDLRASRRWYALGARRGDAESQYDLGFMLLLGEGGPVDEPGGLALLRAAADNGSDSAASLLSCVYRDGRHGVATDLELSERYERRAEELRARTATDAPTGGPSTSVTESTSPHDEPDAK